MSEAIVDATRTEKSIQYDHVAIYTHINDVPSVIEANPKHGVACRPLSEFLKDIPNINDKKGVTRTSWFLGSQYQIYASVL